MDKYYKIKPIQSAIIYFTIFFLIISLLLLSAFFIFLILKILTIPNSKMGIIAIILCSYFYICFLYFLTLFYKIPSKIIKTEKDSLMFKNLFYSKEIPFADIKSIKAIWFTNSVLEFKMTKYSMITFTHADGFFDLIHEIKQKNPIIITQGF